MYRMYDMIMKKRNGAEHTADEIRFIVEGFTKGEIPDYQMSAWLMCVYYKGMTHDETCALTHAMAESGDQLSLAAIHGVKVDKHSTGGVGDKTTFIVAPILASLGVPVAKMSGRGLGHTGGTIDKLEAIPGFCVSIPETEFIEHVNSMKLALVGQTGDLAPADKKIYALRDVTATVDSLPLITSSIMPKKLAAGSHSIVLDVKVGSGAFMKTLDDARKLAENMVAIGKACGRNVRAVLSNMDVPLGMAIGNALEVQEAAEILQGRGCEDLRGVCMTLAANMVELCNGWDEDFAKQQVHEAVASGKAFEQMKRWIAAQGGDASVLEDFSKLPQASTVHEILAPQDGWISRMDTQKVGEASSILGAGRMTKEDTIDFAAGIVLSKKTGDFAKKGDVLARLYTNKPEAIAESEAMFLRALCWSEEQPAPETLIFDIIR